MILLVQVILLLERIVFLWRRKVSVYVYADVYIRLLWRRRHLAIVQVAIVNSIVTLVVLTLAVGNLASLVFLRLVLGLIEAFLRAIVLGVGVFWGFF